MRGKIHPFAEATCLNCVRQVAADCEDNVTASWNDMLAVAPDFREISNSSTKHFRENAESSTNGWIPCSERMPPENTGVLVATEFDGPGDWRMKWGTRVPGHPDAKNGWLIPGASWTPSHWQPLPEPPCK
ncbi:DUF551 domain-containing protein [Cronobacter sakazakii]|nr:DUF551 domain-containing protein [Cronobacter sakazakii]